MIQKTFHFTDMTGFEAIVETIKEDRDYQESSSTLFQLYNPRLDMDEERMVEVLNKTFLNACVTGITSANLAPGKIDLGNFPVELSMTCFRETTVIQYDFDMSTTTSFHAGRVMNEILGDLEDVKCLQIFYASNSNSICTFMREFHHHHLPTFGIKAGRNAEKKNTAHLYGTAVYENAFVVVAFVSKSLKIYMDNNLGWTPIGIEMAITGTSGDNVVTEIDKKPAVEVFSKYLKVAPNRFFMQNVCEFPLILDRDHFKLARVPIGCDESGAVYFSSDVHKGEHFRLAYADKTKLMSLTLKSAMDLNLFRPDAVYLFECGNRVMFLGTDVIMEKNHYQMYQPNLSEAVGYGELFVMPNGEGGDLNSTLVVVGLKEDAQGEDRIVPCRTFDNIPESADQNREIPFLERILTFLESTSEELNALNKKLGKLAYLDQLTKIYNRWELENKMKETLGLVGKHHSYGLIFIDIDHFKAVNDTYGHDVGDNVLLGVVNLMKDFQKQGHAFGRWGGEEFLYILPVANEEALVAFAEEIRKAVDEICFVTVKHVSISAGVTMARADDTPETFVKRADEALYEAKTTGRNKVVLAK